MTKRKIIDTEKKVRTLTEEESRLVDAGFEAGCFFELTKANIQEISDIENDEGFKMSAKLVWLEKFHDIIRKDYLTDAQYNMICMFMFSEDDR